jgi:hypothetical protein
MDHSKPPTKFGNNYVHDPAGNLGHPQRPSSPPVLGSKAKIDPGKGAGWANSLLSKVFGSPNPIVAKRGVVLAPEPEKIKATDRVDGFSGQRGQTGLEKRESKKSEDSKADGSEHWDIGGLAGVAAKSPAEPLIKVVDPKLAKAGMEDVGQRQEPKGGKQAASVSLFPEPPTYDEIINWRSKRVSTQDVSIKPSRGMDI